MRIVPTAPRGRAAPGAGSSVTLVAVALLCSAGLGLAPAVLTPSQTLLVFAAFLGILVALLLRRALLGTSPRQAVAGGALGAVDDEASADRVLRLQRLLFYLGALMVTQPTIRPALGLTLSEIFFIASFVGCAFAVLRGHRIARLPAALVAGVGLFAFGGAISSFGAVSPGESGAEVLHAVYVMLLWVWAGAMVLRTRRQLLVAITLATISAAASGFGAITQVAGVEALAGPLEGNRATGFADHPNDLGAALGIALVPALMLATRRVPGQPSLVRLMRWLVVALIAIGIALSASVAGMAGALVAILVWLVSPSVRASSRVAIVAGLAGALVVATVVAGGSVTSPTERLEQVTSPASSTSPAAGSGEQRVEIVRTAWPTIRDNPVVGTGLDTPDTVVTVLSGGRTVPYQVHGAPLAAWYSAGIFGLIGLLLVIGAVIATGWRAVSAATTDEDRLVGWALLAAFAAFLVYAMTAPLFFQQYGWFAAVLVIAWSNCSLVLGARPVPEARRAWQPGALPSPQVSAR